MQNLPRFALRLALVLAGFLVLAPFGASAKAVYSWVPDDRAGCCRGVLEISDEAYFAGHAAWKSGEGADSMEIERFIFEGSFRVLDERKLNPEHPTIDIHVNTVLAHEPPDARCCEWDIEVRITPTGLEGHTRLKTKGDAVSLSGEGDYWGMDLVRSDFLPSGIVCGEAPKGECANAGGRWVLISAPTKK